MSLCNSLLRTRGCELTALNCAGSVNQLSGKASQSSPYISLSQSLESTIAKLSNALAGDAEHRADFLESMLASGFETEVETQNFRIARRKSRKCRLDLIVEEAVHCFLFGIGHFVSNETLDQRAIS